MTAEAIHSWPFSLLPNVTESAWLEAERVALRANDEYLSEFVEGHVLCPYAREARRRGETTRYVHVQRGLDLSALIDLFVRVAADENQIVAQVIFPALRVDPQEWIEFCHQLTRLGHQRRGGQDVLANAALHPHLSYHLGNPYSLIPLFRRAPDATLQWVRLDHLERLYEGRAKGSTFVDPAQLMSLLDSPRVVSLYDRVAEANQSTALKVGVAQMEAELAHIHQSAQTAYREIWPDLAAAP